MVFDYMFWYGIVRSLFDFLLAPFAMVRTCVPDLDHLRLVKLWKDPTRLQAIRIRVCLLLLLFPTTGGQVLSNTWWKSEPT